LADITGVRVAFNAYLRDNPNATDDNKKNFFKIYAQIWAASSDKKQTCKHVKSSDPHSIAIYRVDNTLRQIKEFGELFKCKNSDKMVNSNRCVIFGK